MSLVVSVPLTVRDIDLLGFVLQRDCVVENKQVSYPARICTVQFTGMYRRFEKEALGYLYQARLRAQEKTEATLQELHGSEVNALRAELEAIGVNAQTEKDPEKMNELMAKQQEILPKLQAFAQEADEKLREDKELTDDYTVTVHEINFSTTGLGLIIDAFSGFLFSPGSNPIHRFASDVFEKLEAALKDAGAKPVSNESAA